MKTHILLDLNNLFHRAKHASSGNIDIKTGLSLYIINNSISKVWKKFKGDHLVVVLDGRSWRRELYPKYKLSRRIKAINKSSKEKDDDEILNDALNQFISFLKEKTNVTVLQSPGLEADDFIALWIKKHSDYNHIIISTDSDFYQLLSDKVKIYNGIQNILITKDGVYDDNDKKLEFSIKNDGKLKIIKENEDFNPPIDWIEWIKFIKIMRGDSGDGIFSAYPKVRQNQLLKAFNDREKKGYIWLNLMMQDWKDIEGKTHRVLDCYNLNKLLIDLTEIPKEIENLGFSIIENVEQKQIPNIGIWFLKFCHNFGLTRMETYPDNYLAFLTKKYE